jgi:RHS repeat-associated protein
MAAATYDAANQLLTWNGAAHTYDANGNLTGDGTKTYTWNARNELIGIAGGGTTASFAYDGLGRRTTRTVDGTTTTFLYDGLNRLKATSGATSTLMLEGLGLDQHFAQIQGTTVTSFLADALGSTYTLTDSAGAVSAQYKYEPYGAATKMSGTASTDLLFTGREDDATGLFGYRARYYQPSRGRFVSEDPLGGGETLDSSELEGLPHTTRFFSSQNLVEAIGGGAAKPVVMDEGLYGYAANNPLRYVDPEGLAATPNSPGGHKCWAWWIADWIGCHAKCQDLASLERCERLARKNFDACMRGIDHPFPYPWKWKPRPKFR